MFFSRVMRSVFELGAKDLASRLKTKYSVTCFRAWRKLKQRDSRKICLSVSWFS